MRTDFILSAEIIAITLGAVAQADFWTQVAVLVGIALIMTVGVYGLVGGIVKLDDLGLWLSQKSSSAAQAVVHMAGRKHKPEFRLQGQQDAQQCHAVCPAGHCCGQVQRLARTKQLFSQNKHAHMRQNFFIVHQRLKSTSIKRVWAPSQPSGTVLVSP